MIFVKISNISLSNLGFVILLKDKNQVYTLPIFIGIPEAQSINIQFNKLKSTRPLTHDLIENILKLLNCKISKIIINDLIDNTFYSTIVIESKDDKFMLDSRPSDAIALALRFNIPIYVKRKVMEIAAIKSNKDENKKDKEKSPKSKIEILKEQLNHAVKEERYEDAAKFRDEINNIKSS